MKFRLDLCSSFARATLSAVLVAATAITFAACSADGNLDLGPDASGPDASTPETAAPVTDGGSEDAPVGPALCGNKKVDKGEECDDGNTANNDGCSSACKIESAGPADVCGGATIALTKEDASTLYKGSVTGTTTGLFNHYSSVCGGGSGPDAVYRIDPPMTGRATARITADFSAILSARTGCTDAKTELGCADDSLGTGGDISLAFPVFQGAPVYLFVDGYGGAGGEFAIDIDVQTAVCGNGKAEYPESCDDGNTNDGDGCSSTCTLDDTTSATECPGMAYRLVATPSSAGLVSFAGDTSVLSHKEGNATGCFSTGSGPNAVHAITPSVTGNLSLSLLANYPNALVHVRRQCDENETQVDCSGASEALVPVKTSIPVVAEQTVYVFVDSGSTSAKGLYTLDAKLTVAACGNGVLDSGEECDDGNTADTDGCSSTCVVERDTASYICPGQLLRLKDAAPGPRSLHVTGTTAPLAGESVPASKSRSCGANNNTTPDAVYQVSSDIDGWATVRVKGVFNATVAAKTTCVATTNIACADSAGGSAEEVLTFAMNKDTPYFLFVDGEATGQQGFFTLDIEVVPSVCGNSVVEGGETCDDGAVGNGDGCDATCKLEPASLHDVCTTAPLTPLEDRGNDVVGVTISTGNTNLTKPASPTNSLAPCSSRWADGYWPFKVDFDGVATARITSASFRPALAVRTACTGSNQLMCNDDETNGGQEITFAVDANKTYWLAVAGQNVVSGQPEIGRFTLDINVVPKGCGDSFLNAPEECDDANKADGDGCSSECKVEALAGIDACNGHPVTLTGTGSEPRQATVTVGTAGLPSNTSSICGGSGPEGILVITPDVDGQLSIKGTGAHPFVLYARTKCDDPTTEVSKQSCSTTNMRSISGPVQKNVPHYVYVDGLNGASGVTKLQITVTP